MNIQRAIDAFLLDHKARGSRPRTVEWHGQVLNILLRDMLEAEVSTLDVFTVNSVLDRDVKPNTLANYERSLRAFTNWLLGVEVLTRDPFKGKRRVKQVFEHKRTLTHAEIQALFRAVRAVKRMETRNMALLALFLDTGLRAAEVARLKLADVNWETGTLRVDGKTGPGTVAFGRHTLKLLRCYVTHARRTTDPHLFVFDGKPLTSPSLSRWAKRLGQRAGLGDDIGCHTFRRTFATICIENGMDFFSLQRAMRHATPAMTQRYINLDFSHVRRQIDRNGPLAGLMLPD
ncbi:tyrosine-type recombinase/integrase [Deinococcus xianganensis]|uniref:Tyrosine-type recombinase/integrase n=2 Tax=Deinococcus xianganensis TaxID=1507289 RepID=A0A6I4YNB6_9DEIO|nr:tyrosine-type recombinase/integrase [Deinococcus xianganensis]